MVPSELFSRESGDPCSEAPSDSLECLRLTVGCQRASTSATAGGRHCFLAGYQEVLPQRSTDNDIYRSAHRKWPCTVPVRREQSAPRRMDLADRLSMQGLVAPGELAEERVRPRFASQEFWRPVMEPGDALLFRGDIIHRTHVTSTMTRDRTSLELRFFSADRVPARLEGDRFIPLEGRAPIRS